MIMYIFGKINFVTWI